MTLRSQLGHCGVNNDTAESITVGHRGRGVRLVLCNEKNIDFNELCGTFDLQ